MVDLITTLDVSGEFDALAKLRPGEPYFVLIGRDGLAPGLLEEWADKNRRRAIEDFNADPPRISKELYERECRKSTEAEMKAADMRTYKRQQGKALPREGEQSANPVTGDTRPTYTGFELDEDTKKRDALQAARARASAAINNAVAELHNLGELVGEDELGLMCDTEEQALRELAELVQPPRVGIAA